MDLRRCLPAALVLAVLLGCQAPAPPTPTAVPQQPTAAPAPPTLAPAPPTLAPIVPTASPSAPTPTAPTAPAASATRVETLNAANAAFKAADLKTAAGLYDRVVNTPPGTSEAPTATTAIDDFAWFRGMVTLLADGREDEARAALDALRQRDPTAPLARLGDQLYNQYGMVGQLRGACAQLSPQVQTQAGPTLATLQGLGVTNVDATSLCTTPQN